MLGFHFGGYGFLRVAGGRNPLELNFVTSGDLQKGSELSQLATQFAGARQSILGTETSSRSAADMPRCAPAAATALSSSRRIDGILSSQRSRLRIAHRPEDGQAGIADLGIAPKLGIFLKQTSARLPITRATAGSEIVPAAQTRPLSASALRGFSRVAVSTPWVTGSPRGRPGCPTKGNQAPMTSMNGR